MAKKGKRRKRGEPASMGVAKAPTASAPAVDQAGAAPSAPAESAVALAAPSPRSLALANAFIALFLAYQVLMPLRYYLSDSRHDERFSWRMFSSLRMQQCKVNVLERVGGEERRVELRREVQVAWIGMLERYRLAVVDKFLARRCEEPGVTEVRLVRSCTETDGAPLPDVARERSCAEGAARDGTRGAAP